MVVSREASRTEAPQTMAMRRKVGAWASDVSIGGGRRGSLAEPGPTPREQPTQDGLGPTWHRGTGPATAFATACAAVSATARVAVSATACVAVSATACATA